MTKLILFILLSIPVIYISRKNLTRLQSHGFYRFIAWELMIWLFVNVYRVWFHDPWSVPHIISWLCLVISLLLLVSGVVKLRGAGMADNGKRSEEELYAIEKTTVLVDAGIYRYLRHPLYASLFYLNWGIFFKDPDLHLLIVALCATLFLILTALRDESECKKVFGVSYEEYMKKTKRFIPFLF